MKKNKSNSTTIDYFSLGHPLSRLRSHFAVKARRKMFDLFIINMRPNEFSKVLDVGVTPDQTLPESNFFEKYYPFKENLVATSIEDVSFLEDVYPGVKFVKTVDALPFRDKEFDILFCSAVLEHVGDREAQRAFVAECLRVSKQFFFTTPNRYFPVEFHTIIPLIHWLPQNIHQTILKGLGLTFWAKTENLNLFTPKELIDIFPKEISINLYNYKLFGLPSNIVVCGIQNDF